MIDEIISYREMCDRESMQTLQRGMNFRLRSGHSVILMSRRSNAPYSDRILPDNRTIEYQGHDEPRTKDVPNPKAVDQPEFTKNGRLTQNGHFIAAVNAFKTDDQPAERVRVYEKLFDGVWSYKGVFELVAYVKNREEDRAVYKFILRLSPKQDGESDSYLSERGRIIPTEVKKEVWKRDGGKCVICGATDELHFDHDIPYSKGGTSVRAENVRILCARHNLKKGAKIE